MARVAENVIRIPGPNNPDRTYLEVIADYDKQRVIVQPGTSRRRLPRFWGIWLRENILELTPERHTVTIRLVGSRVYVTCAQGYDKALTITVAAAQRIYDLPEVLLRVRNGHKGFSSLEWHVLGTESHDDNVGAVLDELVLPEGFRIVRPWSFGTKLAVIRLEVTRPSPLSVSDAGKLVELRYSQALARLVHA